MARGNQVTRWILILNALESSHRGHTVEELTALLDGRGKIRSVYRDLDELSALFPIESHDGRWIWSGPRERRTLPLKATHLLALQALLRAYTSDTRHSLFGEALSDLERILSSTLTPHERALCDELAATRAISFSGPIRPSEDLHQTREVIEEAIYQEQRLALSYRKPNHPPTRRVVDPYALWEHNGRPYLVAVEHEKPKTFSLSRVADLEILDDTFERDPDFDLHAFKRRTFGIYDETEPVQVTLRFHREVAHLAHERTIHPSQHITPEPDGSVTIEMTTSGHKELAAWIAGFGGRVEALQPTSLRAEVIRRCREGLLAHEAPQTIKPLSPDDNGVGYTDEARNKEPEDRGPAHDSV